EPVAASAEEQGYALLDRDGVRVGTADTVPDQLPEVTVPLADAEQTGPALTAVLDVVDALPATLLEQVAEAGARSDRTVELVLDDGATVRWGTAQENDLKAAVLEVLRAEQEAAVYDVSVPRAPTTSA
ncbi:cell division protein FtsQ/DivIB, partial [Georgenia sp. 10Sc9-8]|nr:cell division protein FtsQ/DivIB [Georgenia halotolerans]